MDDIIAGFLGTSISKSNPIKDNRVYSKGFATLLTNDNFYPGVEALCKSLKATNTGNEYFTIISFSLVKNISLMIVIVTYYYCTIDYWLVIISGQYNLTQQF